MNKIDTDLAAKSPASPPPRPTPVVSPTETARRRVMKFWRWMSLALPDASGMMFRQKLTAHGVMLLMQPDETGAVDKERIRSRIALLQARCALPFCGNEWSYANEIELLLVGLMTEDEMRVETRRQLIDARNLKFPALAEFEKMFESFTGNETALRAMLLRLLIEIQDKFRKRHLLREFIAAYTARVSLLFALATSVFMVLMIVLSHLANDLYLSIEHARRAAGEGPPMPDLFGGVRAFSSFYVALAAGLFGAAFSMMAQTKKRVEISTLEDMRANSRFAILFFRLGVGIGAAMILYFIFDTQLFGDGALTPKLPLAGFEVSREAADGPLVAIGALSPNRDLSLLMLWCFVAGFSEVLVPSILRKAEGRAIADK
ncbi:MAG: hypothetical protein AAF360_00985 [Pseudomonadota bacterium]